MIKGAVFLCLFTTVLSAPNLICPSQEDASQILKFSDPGNINNYFICVKGVPTLMTCENDKIFDIGKSECVGPETGSKDVPISVSGKRTKQEYDISKLKRRLMSFDYGDRYDYQCKPKGVYDDVYPGNCRKYYHCNNGSLSVEECFIFRDFDPVQLKCRWWFLVDCSAKRHTTTEAPTTAGTTAGTTKAGSTGTAGTTKAATTETAGTTKSATAATTKAATTETAGTTKSATTKAATTETAGTTKATGPTQPTTKGTSEPTQKSTVTSTTTEPTTQSSTETTTTSPSAKTETTSSATTVTPTHTTVTASTTVTTETTLTTTETTTTTKPPVTHHKHHKHHKKHHKTTRHPHHFVTNGNNSIPN